MSNYLRAYIPGGTYFFTVVTHRRRAILTSDSARECLRKSIELTRKESHFDMPGFVLLPDHLHCLWTLPVGDQDFSIRWANIKRCFTKLWKIQGGADGPISASRKLHREAGVWQRRFWEHFIRDEDDFIQHLDYIHYNPIKHGLVERVCDWPYSSFHRCVRQGWYDVNWASGGECVPQFDRINEHMIE